MALRWKKDETEKGLARIGAGPRGFILRDGETELARVYAKGGGWRGPVLGWYWTACGEVPHINTHLTLVATPEEAKMAAVLYVRQHYKKPSAA